MRNFPVYILTVMLLVVAVAIPELVSVSPAALAREHARIVASREAAPYARAIAQARTKKHAEETGQGAPDVQIMTDKRAVQAFCRGAGRRKAPILLLARALSVAERKACTSGSVLKSKSEDDEQDEIGREGGLTELMLGREALVLAQARGAPGMELAPLQLYLALAARVPVNGRLTPNPYRRWDELDPSLPMREIRMIMPRSGNLRETLVREVLHKVCLNGMHPYWDALKTQLANDAAFRQRVREDCSSLREDGAVMTVDDGAAAASRLEADVKMAADGQWALGLLGRAALQAHGNLETLGLGSAGADGKGHGGTLSRPLYLYTRDVATARDFLAEVLSDRALGNKGYLTQQGLIPLPARERARLRAMLRQGAPDGDVVIDMTQPKNNPDIGQ